MSDPDTVRPGEEKERWQARDPLVMFERILLGEGVISREEADSVKARVQERVDEATRLAEEAEPVPEAELAAHVYANPWSADPRGSVLMPEAS